MMTGDTNDISFICEFGFYDWVWCISPQGAEQHRDLQRKRLGKCLGPSISVGSAMCGVVLTEKGTRLDRTSIIPLTVEDRNNEAINKMKLKFESLLETKLKEWIKGLKSGKDALALDDEMEKQMTELIEEETPQVDACDPWSLEELGHKPGMEPDEKPPPPEIPDADDFDHNRHISAKVRLPKDGHTFSVILT